MPARFIHKTRLSDIGEFGFIDRIKKQAGKSISGVRGIGDDTAVVPLSSGKCMLLTTDMLLEDVHFTLKMSRRGIGHKAIASNISDIAAMGGIPQYAVISLGVPSRCSWSAISQIYQGLDTTAKSYGIQIVGGDTVRSKKIIINVALVGTVETKNIVYRKGSHVGDQIYVTGPLGRSLKSGWHLRFTPRIKEARYLVGHYKPSAMIDISDGLVADLGHILKESRVGAVLDEKSIPRRRGATLSQALYDGEDYELLFTLTPSKAGYLKKAYKNKFRFYKIGEIVPKNKGLRIRTAKGVLHDLRAGGYTHF